MTEKALVPVEQKQVIFYNDELTAVRANDGQIYASVRHMCSALGIKRPQRQTDRMKRDEVMSDGLQRVPIMGTRGPQLSYVLRVDLIPLWLTGIETTRVDDSIKDKIIEYKRKAAKVLWEAFQEGRLSSDTSIDDLLATDSPAAQAYRMAAAIMKMARQQLMLEAQIETHTAQLKQHEDRLEQIETTLGDPDRQITPEQAMQISQGVKTVARELGKRTKRNEYGGVYGELYRRYGINSYKTLPTSKFEDALSWLNDWLQSIIDDTAF